MKESDNETETREGVQVLQCEYMRGYHHSMFSDLVANSLNENQNKKLDEK